MQKDNITPADLQLTLHDLAPKPTWVGWRQETVTRLKRGEKVKVPTKVPYQPARPGKAENNEPATWGTRKAAQARAQDLDDGRKVGVGLMFGPTAAPPDCLVGGIDLDSCLNPETDELTPWAQEVVDRCPTYTERSPSGEGLHLLFLFRADDWEILRAEGLVMGKTAMGREFKLVGDHREIGVFAGLRYFTITEEVFGPARPLCLLPLDTMRWLLGEHGPEVQRRLSTIKTTGGKDDRSADLVAFFCECIRAGVDRYWSVDILESSERNALGHLEEQRDRERAITRAWDKAVAAVAPDGDDDDILGDLPQEDDPPADDPDDVDSEIARMLGLDKPRAKTWLERMNDRHALVRMPNKVAVTTRRRDGTVDFMGTRDLQALYLNHPKVGGANIADAWMRRKSRRTYSDGVAFDPSDRAHPEALNLWTGWEMKPDPRASCAGILAHIRDVICDGNPAHYRYVIGWCAHLVQRPADKPGVALVLRGGKGAGKDTLGVILGRIIGRRHVAHIDQPDKLTGRFNAQFAQAILAHVEEAFWAGDRSKVGVLQSRITARTMPLERKGVDSVEIDSFVRFLMTTNEDWAVPASADERRYAVFDVSPRRMKDEAYFDHLYAEINGKGAAGFLAHLLAVDLSGFSPRKVPQTGALLDQKLASLRGVDRWWYEVLADGTFPDTSGFGGDAWETEAQEVERSSLRAIYETWDSRNRFSGQRVDAASFGRLLKVVCPEVAETRKWADSGPRPKGYRFPPLPICRALFSLWLHGNRESIAWDDEQSRQSHELL